jgi:hypothetical protein
MCVKSFSRQPALTTMYKWSSVTCRRSAQGAQGAMSDSECREQWTALSLA